MISTAKGLLVSVALPLTLLACGTVTHWGKRPDFTQLRMGMSQAEVIEIMGKPEDVAAKKEDDSSLVYMVYTYAPWHDHSGADGNKEYYYVRLVNNEVDSFGHKGDFDSTKPPEQTININLDDD